MILKRKMTDGSTQSVGQALATQIIPRVGILPAADYGADPAGVRDSTTALNTAFAAAAATKQAVILPAGTFLYSGDLLFDGGVAVHGQGRGVTVLKRATGATCSVKTRQFDALTGTSTGSGDHAFHLTGLSIDGRLGSGNGLSIFGVGYTLDDLEIRGCSGIGLRCEGRGLGAGTYGTPGIPLEARMSRLTLWDNKGGNLAMLGPNDTMISDLIAVLGNVGGQTDVANVLFDSYGSSIQLSHAHLWGSHARYQLRTTVAACRYMNVVMEGAYDAQFFIDTPQGGGQIAYGLHVFGQGTGTQKGVVVNGMNSGVIDARGGNFPNGFLVIQQDNGVNDFRIASGDPLSATVSGTRHARSNYTILAGDGSLLDPPA